MVDRQEGIPFGKLTGCHPDPITSITIFLDVLASLDLREGEEVVQICFAIAYQNIANSHVFSPRSGHNLLLALYHKRPALSSPDRAGLFQIRAVDAAIPIQQ